jgi:AraC-like DNA-binding protein
MLEEIYLGWIFMHCLYYLGRAMPVISVTTRDPLHFNLGRDHFAIGAPVRFGPVTSMHFSRSLLSRRTANRAGANPHWDCFRLWLDFIEHREVAGDAARIAGPSRLKEIAARAGVSPSTMRRRLLASDGSFRHARERALVASAVRKLRSTDDSVEAIAFDLGYADARSLRRFLKAATGETPQQLRLSAASQSGNDARVRERLKTIGAVMGR